MSALRLLTAMFDIDTAKATTSLKQLDTGITSAKGALTTMAASIVTAFSISAFKHFITDQIELGSKINDTAEKLGVTTEQLQKFQFAAGLSGVEAEGAGRALQFLNKNLGEAIGGSEEQAKIFKEMGVNLAEVKDGSKGAADLLPQIADKFAAAGSDAERTALSMKIFGKQGAALLPLLKQGSGELAKLAEEFDALGGGMDDGFIKLADQAGDEIDKLKFAMTGLKSRIAVAVLPAVVDFAKKFQGVIVYFQKLTKETHIVKEGLAVLGVVGAAAGLKTAMGWAKFFGLFPKGNAGIVRTLASMGWMGLIIAAVVALALVFEDLFVGIQGGDSIIKNWLQTTLGVEETEQLFKQFGEIVDQIGASFTDMSPSVKALLKSMAEIAMSPEFIAAVEFCVRLLGAAVAESVAFARAIGKIVTGDFKGAGDALNQGDAQAFGDKGFLGASAWKPYAAPAPTVTSPGGGFQRPGDVTQTNQTVIQVNGAGDPNAVGQRVMAFQRDNQNDNAAALAALATGAAQ
jgi:hypothetical protein